ncbi:MAG TPA: tyrosine-type recombinase/integrase [Stellaceae bacterium]|nr:tyrosine-type recombinase/integrase [Stellaceae bacterium]
MPKTHLTDIRIKSLKPQAAQITYWDETLPSFGCRVSPGGTKTFTVMHGENRKRVTIGRYPILSLAKARSKAKEMLAEVTLGKHGTTIAFDDALELFLTTHCTQNNKADTAYETARLLKRHFLPVFKHRSLEDISTQDIAGIVDKLLSTPSECNHAFTAVRTFFRWACRRRYVEHSPCDGLQRPTKPVSRSRVLTDEEIKKVWHAASEMGSYGAIVRLLLLTGQRLNEIASLRWEYISEEGKTITLPPQLTKNNKEHTFPFGKMTAAILGDVANGLLFPTQKNAEVVFNNWSAAKHALDKMCAIPHWTLHDLRRTFATNLAALGTPIHVTEKLLNHSSGAVSGVAAIYNRHTYMNEMRTAVRQWERRLAQLLKS